MARRSPSTVRPSLDTPLPETGWRFLDTPALANALSEVTGFGRARLSSSPNEYEASMRWVLTAMGKLVRQGGRPPMAWYRSVEDARRPADQTDWCGAVLYRPEDGMAILLGYVRDEQETVEQLVQRCLIDSSGAFDGSMQIGRLDDQGHRLDPWAPMNTERTLLWATSTGAEWSLRDALAGLATSTRRGGLRKAYQAWEQTLLLEAAGPCEDAAQDLASTMPRPSRRL